MKSSGFQEMDVWKLAHALVLRIYKMTEAFPRHELYGLTSQLRRAAVSVPANLAEGYRKKTVPDKARFYNISQGSLEECRYYMILARDLQYSNTTELKPNLTASLKFWIHISKECSQTITINKHVGIR